MKKILVISILSVFLFIGCHSVGARYHHPVPPEPPHKVRYYDKHHRYKGYSERHHDRTRYYDKHGRYQGYSIHHRHYDKHGRYIGRTNENERRLTK